MNKRFTFDQRLEPAPHDGVQARLAGSRVAARSNRASIRNGAIFTVGLAILALLVVLSTPPTAFAQAKCTDRPECWPEGSAVHTLLVLVQQQKVADKFLTGEHEELVKLVASSSTEEIKVESGLLVALRAQQAAWLRYRTHECELVGSLTGAGGNWPAAHALRCELDHIDQRLGIVRAAIQCVAAIPSENRIFEQISCLGKLAPLTNR